MKRFIYLSALVFTMVSCSNVSNIKKSTNVAELTYVLIKNSDGTNDVKITFKAKGKTDTLNVKNVGELPIALVVKDSVNY